MCPARPGSRSSRRAGARPVRQMQFGVCRPGGMVRHRQKVIIGTLSTRTGDFSVSHSDVNMLVCTSGRERTEREFRQLLAAAGFSYERVTSCPPTSYGVIKGHSGA
jgi:hypothetical protein